MTPAEKRLLDFITERLETTECSPTFREMAAHFGLKSKTGVHTKVESLIDQGYLVRRPGSHRGLALPTHNLSRVPTYDLRAELARRNQGERV